VYIDGRPKMSGNIARIINNTRPTGQQERNPIAYLRGMKEIKYLYV
jgi:hypothetical protein